MIYTKLKTNIPCEILEREKWFVASCPILDIHSQGKTAEEAKENLSEAVDLFFLSCSERRVVL